MERERLLLALLNSRPPVRKDVRDELGTPAEGRRWLRRHGGRGSSAELEAVRRARQLLEEVVRGRATPSALAGVIAGVRQEPRFDQDGLQWDLVVDDDHRLAVEAVLAWGDLSCSAPGRLRACANPECTLFLLDRSPANTGRWCSMATCGNRMKAQRHRFRLRSAHD